LGLLMIGVTRLEVEQSMEDEGFMKTARGKTRRT
jgi:hypothetical protein